MNINRDLPDLLEAGVINQDTADRIKEYYKLKDGSSGNRIFVVFGILGAILVSLGIILILAHNWDELSRLTKTFFAFLPLIIGQGLCVFALIKKQYSTAWMESTSAFLFFSIGACISLISQIYNIPGDLSSFLLTWMLLAVPLIYVMNSSVTSLLYITGITYYACETSYWSYPSSESYEYWMLLLLVIPHYYLLRKFKAHSNFLIFHNWLMPLSLIIILGTVADAAEDLMAIAYMSLFGLFYLIGEMFFQHEQRPRNSGFKILGSLGTIVMLLALSFDWFWEENLSFKTMNFREVLIAPEFIASALITLLASILFYRNQKTKPFKNISLLSLTFLLFILTYFIGMNSTYTNGTYSVIAMVIININIFSIGIDTIRQGVKLDHLGILNFGLLIITALIVCRFFDTDLSFILRGILFIAVGAGFFVTNYWMLKIRRTHA